MLEDACKKLEAQMKNSEIRSPMDGLLTAIKTIDGELVADRAELLTVSSRKNYVRGEVDDARVWLATPCSSTHFEVAFASGGEHAVKSGLTNIAALSAGWSCLLRWST